MVEKAETTFSAPDFVTSPELIEGIEKDRITTFTITKRVLRYYEQAAINVEKNQNIKYEVTVIANPGEYYLTGKDIISKRRNPNGKVTVTSTTTAEKSKDPVREGSIALSLKRPEGVTNDIAFHTERQRIQPANA